MKIYIQEFLRNNNIQLSDIDNYNFKDELGIKCSEYNGYCLFVYHNIVSDWTDLKKQTRGIILDGKNNWNVVNFPFTKFFNMGESTAAEIDWSSANVFEKLDGSIIYVWWAERLNKWMVSTSGTCNAYQAMANFDKSFGDIAKKAFDNVLYDSSIELMFNKSYCYMFELQSMYNQIVVKQDNNEGTITLTGIRNLTNFQEIDIYSKEAKGAFGNYNIIPKVYKHKLFKPDLFKYVNSRKATDAEGIVVVDKNFNRLKVKSKEYILVHKTKDTMMSSWKNVIELVLSDSLDDVQAMLSDSEKSRIEYVKTKIEKYINDYKELIENLPEKCKTERREMGIYLSQNAPLNEKFNTLIWNNYFGTKDIISIIKDMNLNKLKDILINQ